MRGKTARKIPSASEWRPTGIELAPLICERWMSLEVLTVKPKDTVAHARALLEEYRINQLPVVKNRDLVGIVTDRDLRDAANAVTTSARLAGVPEPPPGLPNKITVDEVMTRKLLTLSPRSSLITAAELMLRERIGSVPIVDGKQLVGMVTRSDLLHAFVGVARMFGDEDTVSRVKGKARAARKGT